MNETQLSTYEHEFGLKTPIRPPQRNGIRGVGDITKMIGEARIKIPFADLGVVIDVDFAIKEDEKVPYLLYNKYILDNGLDVYLPNRCLCIGPSHQPLSMENYFVVHRWKADGTPYQMYTEN